MSNTIHRIKTGFTLIEILVVITIISVLVGIVLFGLGGSQEKARDTVRQSDLKQYQVALENYANENGNKYPRSSGVLATDICGPSNDLNDLSSCPDDPNGVDHYMYVVSDSGNDYAVYAGLESKEGYNWINYSSGIVGVYTVKPTSETVGAGSAGASCTAPRYASCEDGYCYDTQNDPNNCGGCGDGSGAVCSGGTPYCVDSECSATEVPVPPCEPAGYCPSNCGAGGEDCTLIDPTYICSTVQTCVAPPPPSGCAIPGTCDDSCGTGYTDCTISGQICGTNGYCIVDPASACGPGQCDWDCGTGSLDCTQYGMICNTFNGTCDYE